LVVSIDAAEEALESLVSELSILVDDFATNQSDFSDDQGDLDSAASRVATAFAAMADTLGALFQEQLQRLKESAELDEVMSLLGRTLGSEPAQHGADAAGRILHVLQNINYGVFSDPDPDAEQPDIEGDFATLEEGLDAILAVAREADDAK
jgi:hypothetical protein